MIEKPNRLEIIAERCFPQPIGVPSRFIVNYIILINRFSSFSAKSKGVLDKCGDIKLEITGQMIDGARVFKHIIEKEELPEIYDIDCFENTKEFIKAAIAEYYAPYLFFLLEINKRYNH